jgi:hypothetical protein
MAVVFKTDPAKAKYDLIFAGLLFVAGLLSIVIAQAFAFFVEARGQTCRDLYRLINDVPRSDFRLEEARAEDHAKVR